MTTFATQVQHGTKLLLHAWGAPQPWDNGLVCVLPQGVPIRMELGPKDLAGEAVVLVRRDTGAKTPVPWADVAAAVPRLLKTIHVGFWQRFPAGVLTRFQTHKTVLRSDVPGDGGVADTASMSHMSAPRLAVRMHAGICRPGTGWTTC